MTKEIHCPRCRVTTLREPEVHNALSRRDNKTHICSDCGTEEALFDYAQYQTESGAGFTPVGLDVWTREAQFKKLIGK